MISIANDVSSREKSALACTLISLLLLVSACSSGQSSNSATGPAYSSPTTPPQPPTMVAANANAAAPRHMVTPSPAAVSTPTPSQEHLMGVGSATLVTLHGKIISVDRPKKLVTLEGPGGKTVTLRVENPYNLAAAEPGKSFVAKFYEIVTIRKKQPDESPPAASLAEGIVSAMPGQTPGAAIASSIEVMATIVAVNTAKGTVDLQGPDGVIETVRVANRANLRHVKVGNDIVVRLTRVIAISLEKESET